MAINFNTDPYYDDFSADKGFLKILFKPGVAVQARELTQMQSALQNQIKSLGDHILKDGVVILGGERSLDTNYQSVKLQASYTDANSTTYLASEVGTPLVGDIVTGQTTGVEAKVVGFATANAEGDPPTIFVKYLNSGTDGLTKTFADDEVLINTFYNQKAKTALTAACNIGAAFTVTSGIAYVKGHFVHFPQQTKVISKYTNVVTAIAGFDITENILTSEDDATLLDPANGSYNFAAPGADRYTITLTLNTKPLVPEDISSEVFMELTRISKNSILTGGNTDIYSAIGDALARRTYDESGDYVVKPFRLKLQEHLQSSSNLNGYYPASKGGDDNKFVGVVSPGKAYVKGYEVDNIKIAAIDADKARDFNTVTNGSVFVPFGNYVNITNVNSGLQTLAQLPQVTLYDQYNATPGTPNGSVVGTARIRHIDYSSGTIGSTTSIYRAYLFDVQLNPGKSFSDDVKQLYLTNSSYDDFTSDIVSEETLLAGSVSTSSSSSVLTGTGTRFTTQLKIGAYINVAGSRYRITGITNDLTAAISPSAASTVNGSLYYIQSSVIEDTDKNAYIFPLPVSIIKTIDSTGFDTTYSTRRVFSATLTAGTAQFSAGINETFSSYSTDNYQLFDSAGQYVDISAAITFTGVNTQVNLDLSGLGYTTESILLVATVQKTGSAADKKTKTLQSNSVVDVISQNGATAKTIPLNKADIYRLVSIKMSTAAAFGSPYDDTTEIDITSRYDLDNGQRLTHYGLGSIKLKARAAAPTGPIRITFDYFTHQAGDYFTVDSYSIPYADIPTVTISGKEYVLRDCLDFRPRINDAGTGFSGTGASVGEFPDFENDIVTTYQYYLPRIDIMVINRYGKLYIVKGKSATSPKEPKVPDDSVGLYVFNQKAYVFDVKEDIEVTPIDNRRFTMRQIGRLENRIKNVEYYTQLNMLENETKAYQIKDADGLDRFKNGFFVDDFSGHGVGDVFNSDYGVAIDYNKKELRPVSTAVFLNLEETNTTQVDRISNGYVKIGDHFTLKFTEERFIANNKATTTININPYAMNTGIGKITSNKSSDVWFDVNRLPDIYRDVNGNYDSLSPNANGKGSTGTVWGAWETLQYGVQGGTEEVRRRSGTQTIVQETVDTVTNNDVIQSKTVIPKMRDVSIDFSAEGLKPNTRMQVFFGNINVTADCIVVNDANTSYTPTTLSSSTLASMGNLVQSLKTDIEGNLSGVFHYKASKYDLNTGTYVLRLSDSPKNDPKLETTSAQMTFTSSGELRNVANEIVSTRNAIITTEEVYESTSKFIATQYSAYGTSLGTKCKGKNLYGIYADGSGGSFETLIKTNDIEVCGYADPATTHPAQGTFIAYDECDGFSKSAQYADGFGGTYQAIAIENSPDCGYSNSTPNCTASGSLISAACAGYTRTQTYADGNCGTYTVVNEFSEACGYEIAVTNEDDETTFVIDVAYDDDNGVYTDSDPTVVNDNSTDRNDVDDAVAFNSATVRATDVVVAYAFGKSVNDQERSAIEKVAAERGLTADVLANVQIADTYITNDGIDWDADGGGYNIPAHNDEAVILFQVVKDILVGGNSIDSVKNASAAGIDEGAADWVANGGDLDTYFNAHALQIVTALANPDKMQEVNPNYQGLAGMISTAMSNGV